jgi:secreted Zn-dependent insulinase-like peptidase
MERRTARIIAKLLILRKLISEPAFNQLRTKKQMGYIVSLGSGDYGRGLNSIGGIELKILSKRFSPFEMEKEVETFFIDQYNHFFQNASTAIAEGDFQLLKESIVTTLKDPMNSLVEEGSQFYTQILNEIPFDWRERTIHQLQQPTNGAGSGIGIQDIQQFYEKYIYSPVKDSAHGSEGDNEKKSFAVMIFNEANSQQITDRKEQCQGTTTKTQFLNRNPVMYSTLDELKEFRSSLSFHDKYIKN